MQSSMRDTMMIEGDPSASLNEKQVLRGLTSRHIGERLAMEQRLKQMGPQSAELLLRILGQEANSRRLKRRLFWVLLSGGLTLMTVLAIFILRGGHPESLGILGTFGSMGALSALM